jgi:hypothetical protein
MQLLVRNKVKNFSTWYAYFKEDSAAAAEYGVTLMSLWQTADDPNDVFSSWMSRTSIEPTRSWQDPSLKRSERNQA